MRFAQADDDAEHQAMIEKLDALVQHLVHQDMRGRQAAAEGDLVTGTQVANYIGQTMSDLTWGGIPTLIMHMANHVGMARMEAVRMSETCETAANGLTEVSQILNENGAPLDLCAQLMDLAVELRNSAQSCLFEPSGCNDGECTHD